MKPLLHILIAFALITQSAAFGQTTFQKAIGGGENEQAYDIVRTSDGAFVAAGETVHPGDFDLDVFLVKFTAEGDTLWTKKIGGNPVSESAKSIRQTNDGGFIICGTRQVTGSGSEDMLLIKTDDMGDVTWSRSFGGPAIESGKTALETDDGGYVVLGTTEDIASPTRICLIKTDADGDTLWTRILSSGPTRYNIATSMAPSADGGFLITGKGNESGGFNGMYIIKLGPDGGVIWARAFNGQFVGTSVKGTSDGGAVALGTYFTTNHDLYLARVDVAGDTLWTRSFGGANFEDAYSVSEANDGGFILAGATRSFTAGLKDAYLVRTDANGDLAWSRSYGIGNFDLALSALQADDGGVVAVGQTSSFGSGASDLYLIRTDASGNSGCNELLSATVVHVPPVTITDVTFQMSSGIAVGNPTAAVRSGSTVVTACLTTAVQETAANDPLLVFPNPTSGPVIIRTPARIRNGQYEVLDIDGRVVLRGVITGTSELLLSIDGLAPGCFIVRIIENGHQYNAKLFVELH